MDKELFRETENKLYRYYKKDKLMESLNAKIKLFESQIKTIDNELKSCNINIEPNIKAISYEERVQTSGDGTSYAERETIRITEYKIKRKTAIMLEKEKILEQIDTIERDALEIEWKIKYFTGELKTLLELKYKKRYGDIKIGEELHLSQSQINKRKRKLIQHIAGWDQWGKIS